MNHTNEDIIEQVANEVNEMMSERAIFVFKKTLFKVSGLKFKVCVWKCIACFKL
jgi:hypothetical protein